MALASVGAKAADQLGYAVSALGRPSSVGIAEARGRGDLLLRLKPRTLRQLAKRDALNVKLYGSGSLQGGDVASSKMVKLRLT